MCERERGEQNGVVDNLAKTLVNVNKLLKRVNSSAFDGVENQVCFLCRVHRAPFGVLARKSGGKGRAILVEGKFNLRLG